MGRRIASIAAPVEVSSIPMSEYQITRWREIPSMVIARDEAGTTAKVALHDRFQVAIDEAAMRLGEIGSDAYLDGWVRDAWELRDGDPAGVAGAVAAELDAGYPPTRVSELLDSSGPRAGE